jgi:hypothetical protein
MMVMEDSMLAYHAKDLLKEHYLDSAEFHAWTDHYQQGLYFDPQNLRGCAVGCWTKNPFGGHEHLAQEMGVPEDLLRLADEIFEALPDGQFQGWPRRFAAAIPVGADLGGVRSRFLQWLLFDPQWGLVALAKMSELGPVLRDMRTFFDWESAGIEISRYLETALEEVVAELIENFKVWHHWDDFAKPETRASRALVKVWEARKPGPRHLAEAAWACRAAWVARQDFSEAMADAFLDMLRKSSVLVETERAFLLKAAFGRPTKLPAKRTGPARRKTDLLGIRGTKAGQNI